MPTGQLARKPASQATQTQTQTTLKDTNPGKKPIGGLKGIPKQSINGKSIQYPRDPRKSRGGGGDGKDNPNQPPGHVEGSEDGGDLYDKLHEVEKVQKALRRASGGEALDQNRIGPDVVYDYTERTPISLWMCKEPLIDYTAVMGKESTDVIPVSPKPEDNLAKEEKSVMLFQQAPKSPAMTWNANLTELEEEEFWAEAAYINDNFKLAYCLPREVETISKSDMQHVNIHNPDGSTEEKDRVRIILSETSTYYHVHINGRTRPDDGSEDTEKVKLRNEKYRKVCQHHLESDGYNDRPTQTFLDRERDKATQLTGIGVVDESQIVNSYIMLDEFAAIKEMDAKRKIKEEEDAIMRALTDKASEDADKQEYKGSSSDEDSDDDDKTLVVSNVDWNRIEEYFEEGEEDAPDEVHDQDLVMSEEDEFDVEVELDAIYAKRQRALRKHRPKVLPDITYSVLVLERIASTNRYHRKHMDIRGFHPLIKRDNSRRLHYAARNNALLDLGPKLKRYWSFKPNITKGKEVTSIAPHPTNGNLLAASYGSNNYTSPAEGHVCIWNIKNINFPERVFTFTSSVTVIAFSKLTPYLLAIGLLDGNIYVYDMRSAKPRAFCSTVTSQEKHFGPVWDLYWLQETEKASAGTVNEVLVSVSDDGYSYRWTSSKGFEPWILLKVRRCPIKIPGRREKRAEALISQQSASFTICFYPDDATLYLIGTEEGFIHKCTSSIAEQFICTYVSHTGPVYRIRFSPFAKDIFISCGGDWFVKIWKEDVPAPLMSFRTDLRTVFDIMWAPNMSTVFVCTSEIYIEVWDVKNSPTEPIIQYRPPGIGLRSVTYSDYIHALIIGDDDGGMTVFGFKNFQIQPRSHEDQMDQLYESLIPGYRRHHKKNAEKKGKRKISIASPQRSLHVPGQEGAGAEGQGKANSKETLNLNVSTEPTIGSSIPGDSNVSAPAGLEVPVPT